MEQHRSKIWLKPEPKHIDEYFGDVLAYLKNPTDTKDTLYQETVSLLRRRVEQLQDERLEKPMYRLENEVADFNVRLCGAWLLAVQDASAAERKQVFLTMLNVLISECEERKSGNSFDDWIEKLLELGIKLLHYDVPEKMPFSWQNIVDFSFEIFMHMVSQVDLTATSECCYENRGTVFVSEDGVRVTQFSQKEYVTNSLNNRCWNTDFLPSYTESVPNSNVIIGAEDRLTQKQQDDISEVSRFVRMILDNPRFELSVNVCQKFYDEGIEVPVEVVKASLSAIELKTIDPKYEEVRGKLMFDSKYFSGAPQVLGQLNEMFPRSLWGQVLKKGDRFKATVFPSKKAFCIMDQFWEFVEDNVDDLYNSKEILEQFVSELAIGLGGDVMQMDTFFIKEYCMMLNLQQRRETKPLERYKIMCVVRLLCAIAGLRQDLDYFTYIARYLELLVVFAQTRDNASRVIERIPIPDDLKAEKSITDKDTALEILQCFGKRYDDTNSQLAPYIEDDNGNISKTASLVLAYNRISEMVKEDAILLGIKKQILSELSVAMDCGKPAEFTDEVEGPFGCEDDMTEFKESFLKAPKDAPEQVQPRAICHCIAGMMNHKGGTIYLGVNDAGKPVGLKREFETLEKEDLRYAKGIDGYMLYITKKGSEFLGEKYWRYVSLQEDKEYNILKIVVQPYPYDVVRLKGEDDVWLRKNNSTAIIQDPKTIEDIRRTRIANLRKVDDKVIHIQDAIQKRLQVRLMGYGSSNSGTVKNRLLEPFHIDDTHEYVQCYEPASKRVKLFKLSRAEEVRVTDKKWEHNHQLEPRDMDAFHMLCNDSSKKKTIKLKLKLQARNAFVATHPRIEKHIKRLDNEWWLLDTYAYDLTPIKAMYLSCAEYIEIVEADGLLEEARAYARKFVLNE